MIRFETARFEHTGPKPRYLRFYRFMRGGFGGFTVCLMWPRRNGGGFTSSGFSVSLGLPKKWK